MCQICRENNGRFRVTDKHAQIFHLHKVIRRTQIRATFNIVKERVNIITLLLLLVLII